MEKFKINYSENSGFIGIKIMFEHLEEGLDYAYENGIKEVCIDVEDIDHKQIVNFDFLKDKKFIETFHWLVPLSKKSDITGLYHLSNLKNLRWWSGKSDFPINLSNLPSLEVLNIGYNKKITGWEKLPKLKRLLLGGVKTEDLSFLQNTTSLEYLRIIKGSLISIKGIENLENLEYIILQSCSKLVAAQSYLDSLNSLKGISIESCKIIDLDKGFKSKWGDKLFFM